MQTLQPILPQSLANCQQEVLEPLIKNISPNSNLIQEISNLVNSDKRDIQQFGQDMENIINQVNNTNTKIKQNKQEIAAIKRDLKELNSYTYTK